MIYAIYKRVIKGDLEGKGDTVRGVAFSIQTKREMRGRYTRRVDSVDTRANEPRRAKHRGVRPLYYNTLSFFEIKNKVSIGMARKCQPLALKIFGLSKMTTSVNDCQPLQ